MTVTTVTSTIDVRTIALRERHPLIFSAFHRLSAGGAFELVNDHDPLGCSHCTHRERVLRLMYLSLNEAAIVLR